MGNIKRVMTVDVEDYFQVAAFNKQISQEEWEKYPLRVIDSTNKILDIFEEKGVKATFFVLGWVAERAPELVKRIASLGHEVASHGYAHQKVFEQTPEEFEADLLKAKHILEEITGQEVIGYRAPSFSIDKRNEWAFDILKRTGHIYSSSTYPIVHDHYGTPEWPVKPFKLESGLIEFPQSTIEVKGKRVPVGGGGYFRLFPQAVNNKLLSQFDESRDNPFIFYFHPWELDPKQPIIPGISLKSKFRHYVNLDKMESKISKLCDKGEWVSMRTAFIDEETKFYEIEAEPVADTVEEEVVASDIDSQPNKPETEETTQAEPVDTSESIKEDKK